MSIRFKCPHCKTSHSATPSLVGRRVRCPNCGELLEVNDATLIDNGDRDNGDRDDGDRDDGDRDDGDGADLEENVERIDLGAGNGRDTNGRDTVQLVPSDDASGDTVLLEAVEVTEAIDSFEPIDVMEAIEDFPGRKPPRAAAAGSIDEDASAALSFKKREREETEMDMTPMVDVTFLLLIFFMVTAAFALQKSIEIPKNNSDEASTNAVVEEEDESDFVTVLVDEYNTYRVTTIEWEEEAPSVQDLHIQLRRARDGDSTGKVPSKLLVEANGEAEHGYVVAALDAGTATGFAEVQLKTVEEED